MSAVAAALDARFKGAQTLVTGGFGLIGSAIAHRLAAAGASVRILDNLDPDSGAHRANLEGIEERVEAVIGELQDPAAARRAVAGVEFVFNIAGLTSHLGSMKAPLRDLEVNARGQLVLLEAFRELNPSARIVFAGTRQIYGRPDYLPVDEKHPLRPPDVNGIDKLAGESFHLLYHRVYGMRTTSLRLTNTYGPRMRIKDAHQTFVGAWIRAVLEGRPFELWGGQQRRDLTYVTDVAEAFLLAAVTPATEGGAFNLGGEKPLPLKDLAEALIAANGGGSYVVKDLPAERRRIDIGDYWGDDRLFRTTTGWVPRVGIAEGLEKSLQFFRTRLATYV